MNYIPQAENCMKKGGRIETIDIAKGLGILFVVWSHAKGPFTPYMYQFHMPLFFLISGFLFNSRNTPAQFLGKKVRSLYIPFVFWNLCSLLITTALHIQEFSDIHLVKKILKIILTLDKDGKFMGATWFLGTLFVVSVVYKLMDYYMPSVKGKSIFLVILFGCVAATGFSINFPYLLSRTLILSFYFAIGRAAKEYKEVIYVYHSGILVCFSIILFAIIGHYNAINMAKNTYTYPFLFAIGALLASYVVIYVSEILQKRTIWIKKALIVMGENSISIVIWQFVVFWIIEAVQFKLFGIPFVQLFENYPPYKTTNGWWIVYLIVGAVASMLIGEIISAVKQGIGRVTKKILMKPYKM